jgi:hypothetical protein
MSAVPLHLLPSDRLGEMEDRVEALQLRAEALRYSGSLHPQSSLLDDLLEARVRQCVLARLSHADSGTRDLPDGRPLPPTTTPPLVEIEAELDLGRCYYDMRLWPHAVARAKKAARLARGAQGAGHAIDKVLQGRIMCLLGEGLARAAPRKGASASHRSAVAHRVLLRAAKLTGLSVSATLGGVETPPNAAPEDHADVYSDDGFEDGGEDAEAALANPTGSSGTNGGNKYLKSALLQTTHAEICEALAGVFKTFAVDAGERLRHEASEAALEWLVGKEGQQRLKERTNELVNRQMQTKAEGAEAGDVGGWRPAGTNIAVLRQEASGRCRHQLIKEATADAQEQLIEQGHVTPYKYIRQSIDCLTQAWELREAAFGQDHAETAMAYERLGAVHARAGRHADNSAGMSRQEHNAQAVRFFTSSRRIFEEFEGAGPGSAACARVSRALRDAHKATGDHESAGQQAALVAGFFEREANRGRRCLEGSTEEESELPILIDSKLGGGKRGCILALRPAVGVHAAAERARHFFELSIRDFSTALRKVDDGDVEIRIGMDCMLSAKASVALSANYFGQLSESVADDLQQLGSLCAEHGWDFRLAEEALQRACEIYKLNGARRQFRECQAKLSSLLHEQKAAEKR